MADEDYIAWEMLYGESGEQSDDWQPPAEWIPVPEPGEYDIYILLQAYTGAYRDTGMNFDYMLAQETTGYTGYGNIHCDWGDGTEDDLNKMGYPQHTYTEEGQYLIHITADENTSFCRGSSTNQAHWLIFKSGTKMTFFCKEYEDNNSYYLMNTFSGRNRLKYVKINHPQGIPLLKRDQFFNNCLCLQKLELGQIYSGDILSYTFSNCYALKKFPVDFDNITSVKDYGFNYCHALRNLHMTNCVSIGRSAFGGNYGGLETVFLPNCTSIGDSAFSGCYRLKSVYAPNCTSVGSGAFASCYNLQEIVVAEDCTFGTNCFQSCYSLYPRPDGSIN